MENQSFKQDDLRLVTWQHKIKYQDTSNFKEGDIVFLNSNPEVEMTVEKVTDTHVYVSWINHSISIVEELQGIEKINLMKIVPQCLMHYENRVLQTCQTSILPQRLDVCFN